MADLKSPPVATMPSSRSQLSLLTEEIAQSSQTSTSGQFRVSSQNLFPAKCVAQTHPSVSIHMSRHSSAVLISKALPTLVPWQLQLVVERIKMHGLVSAVGKDPPESLSKAWKLRAVNRARDTIITGGVVQGGTVLI